MQGLSLSEYNDEEVYILIDQIVYPDRLCATIYKGCSDLASFIRGIRFHDRHEWSGSSFAVHDIQLRWLHCSYFRGENGGKILKEEITVVIMDGHHSQNSIEILEGECAFLWGEKIFRAHHVMQIVWADIKVAEAIILSQVANTSTHCHCQKAHVDFGHHEGRSELHCSFKLQFSVQLVDTIIKDIVDGTTSSNYLLGKTRASFYRNFCFQNLLIKN